ncbi:MAG: DUF1573 domain-containing protein [Planctomycetes bacterium]|jgi:hypothetical protein|nr:DUF1573 domain-containing protein [Planctomycetota bacterium]
MYRFSLMFIALLGATTQAQASSWADGLFEELSRDFGSVPHGQVVTHPFRITNKTKQPVHIRSVTVSCGKCSSARALKTYLQPGEETAIIATMDTNRFIGSKHITITVLFDQPRWDEVKLWMEANSRQDVSFTPNSIAFGRVKRGAEPETKITIAFLGGNPTKVLKVTSESNYVQPKVSEVKRGPGETAFEITAKLRSDTPTGKWYTDVWLTTNNPSMPKLRVPVTVEVEATLSVNPSTVSLGQVKAGTESDRKVIIRGVRPFRITGIFGTDKQLQVRSTNNDSKAVHVLTVTLNPNTPGNLSRIIRVQTDLTNNNQIEFHAQAKVVP